MSSQELSDRERRVLEAVIQSYVATAEPAGSRVISRRFGLGVSPATIRNTMSDLEEKGYLFHPHTSAGRVPTHKAYRLYVDSIIRVEALSQPEQDRLAEELAGAATIEAILRRAAQSLGVLTQELGVAVGPSFDQAVLRRVDLVRIAAERLLMVLTLDGGAIRTIFVEVPVEIAGEAVHEVSGVLSERLGGLTLCEIRQTLPERLRDATPSQAATESLLNIFVAGGGQLFETAAAGDTAQVLLGQPSLLADQPEFSSGDRMRRLLELTETRDELGAMLRQRGGRHPGIAITIGAEHGDPRLDPFTLVTAEYHAGGLSGVIGVIGPTRMPYEKVIALVGHASRLVSDLLQ
ncbi:MAG TPA: heat-inducible transcriptional repressor HrcA [Gemmatirosa sp.]|jgi:heat-inducible transcriptional repressor|nr:heat-inducible transcriptional repressor HrcA [Gemmatirosa sp.]